MPCPLHKITLIFSYWYVDQTRPYWQMYLSLLTNTMYLCTLVQNVPCNAAFFGSISLYKVTSKNSMWHPKIVSPGTMVQVLHICQKQGKMKFQFRSIINLLVTRAAQGHPPVSMRHWWILPSHGVKTVSAILPQIQKISSTNPKNFVNKSKKFRRQIQKILSTNLKKIVDKKNRQQIDKSKN